mgnify:CR=1 FL=1
MKKIVDIVNLNADASCLASEVWLAQLAGGKDSVLYQWLEAYIELNKKVSLGIPGASLADIQKFNPEAIQLINENPAVFEIILRPFAHDNALLRTRFGFELNLNYGIKITNELFGTYTPFFLPPEFMCNNEQIFVLQKNKVEGVFLQPGRFSTEVQERIPEVPYEVRGVLDAKLKCIPFTSSLTKAFLSGIHNYNAEVWNNTISNEIADLQFCWRDGESAFLLPDTAAREKAWLKDEAEDIERCFLKDLEIPFLSNENLPSESFKSYPLHSFAPWLREMRMIGFTNKVQKIEELLEELPLDKQLHWLMVINSDILSSVEKTSPNIEVWNQEDEASEELILWRSERGFEGEDYLSLLKEIGNSRYEGILKHSSEAHILKLEARISLLKSL